MVCRWSVRCISGMLALLLLLLLALVVPARVLAAPDGGADLVILLDRSGSMVRNDPNDLAVTGAGVLLDMLGADDRVAVVAFDTTTRSVVPFALLGDGKAARAALGGLGRPNGQWTDIKGALQQATNILAGQAENERPRAVLLFTDGKPEIGPDGVPAAYRTELDELVERMAGRAIPVFCVGIGQADFAQLSEIATKSRAESLAVTSPTQAVEAFSGVLSRLKERHVVFAFEEDLRPGQVGQQRVLTVPPYTRLLTLSAVSTGTVRLQGSLPDGTPLATAPGLKRSVGANFEVYTISNPAPGTWTVHLEGDGRLATQAQTESALRLRLIRPEPFSQVAAAGHVEVAVKLIGDPDPTAPLELWAQGGGGTAVRLALRGTEYVGKVPPGDGNLALWAVRAGGEVARQEYRLYVATGAHSETPAPKHAGDRWWQYLVGLLLLTGALLGLGAWNWRRLCRREELVSGRLGHLTLRGLGREVLVGAGPALVGSGTPQALATVSARLRPLIWAPLAGLYIGRRQLQMHIRPAPGVRLEINGRPPGDGRLYHGDELRLGGESFLFANPLLPRRPAVVTRRVSGRMTRPLNR